MPFHVILRAIRLEIIHYVSESELIYALVTYRKCLKCSAVDQIGPKLFYSASKDYTQTTPSYRYYADVLLKWENSLAVRYISVQIIINNLYY